MLKRRNRVTSNDVLEEIAAWPTRPFKTEQVERRWRHFSGTPAHVQSVVAGLHQAVNDTLHKIPEASVTCRIAVSSGTTEERWQQGGATEEYWQRGPSHLEETLHAIRRLRDVHQIRALIGDDLWLLLVVVFQRRRPGVRALVFGEVEAITIYGPTVDKLLDKVERLIEPHTSSSVWTYLLPSVILPGLDLHRAGERTPWRDRPLGRFLRWFVTPGLVILAIGWIVKVLFG